MICGPGRVIDSGSWCGFSSTRYRRNDAPAFHAHIPCVFRGGSCCGCRPGGLRPGGAVWVAQDGISLIGGANGASALLWAVRPQLSSHKVEPDFRAAVAFYPDCRISSGLGWSARVPTLLLIGASDDVSSPPACRQMVDGARGRSALARIVVYPGAAHDFDRANLPLHASAGADASVPERGHLAADPQPPPAAQHPPALWLATRPN